MTPHKKRKELKREKAKRHVSGAVAFNFADVGVFERFPVVWTNVADSETFDGLFGPLMAALEERDLKA